MELKGKVALVTGAGRRVGRVIAEHFAERGAFVAVHYNRSRAEAESLVAEIEHAGGHARPYGANLESVLSDLGRRGLTVERINVAKMLNDPLADVVDIPPRPSTRPAPAQVNA